MSLRTVRRIGTIGVIVAILFFFAGEFLASMALQFTAVILALILALFSLIFYRCPSCGRYLGGKRGLRSDDCFCPRCGERVED